VLAGTNRAMRATCSDVQLDISTSRICWPLWVMVRIRSSISTSVEACDRYGSAARLKPCPSRARCGTVFCWTRRLAT